MKPWGTTFLKWIYSSDIAEVFRRINQKNNCYHNATDLRLLFTSASLLLHLMLSKPTVSGQAQRGTQTSMTQPEFETETF